MANISSYNQLSSWNEDDDLLFVQQPDAPKKAHPSQMKEYILEGLDVASVGGTGKYISAISEADGKISATAETMDEVPTQDSNKPVKSGGVFNAIDDSVSLKTATGNPITLTDAANANAEELSMTIEPIQDLHGYSKPWPAGAGKNKCNATTITAECAADGIVSIKIGEITLTETTSLLLSFEQNKAIGSVQRNTLVLRVPNTTTDYYPSNVGQPGLNAGYHEGLIENMPAGTYDVRMWLQSPDIAVSVTNFMIRDASISDNTFEPYSNICPISGLTSGEVQTTNGEDTNTATITFGQTVYGGSVNFKTGEVTVTHGTVTFDGSETWTSSNGNNNACMRVECQMPSGTKANIDNNALTGYVSNMFIEKTPNETYAGGASNIGFSITKYTVSGTVLASICQTGQKNMVVADWKTYLASNPLQICYELANPTTLTLTPAELELLKGNNTITANGAEISIEYYPDNAIGALAGRVDDKADITYVDNVVDGVVKHVAGELSITIPLSDSWTVAIFGTISVTPISAILTVVSGGNVSVTDLTSNSLASRADISVSVSDKTITLTSKNTDKFYVNIVY